MDRSTTVKEEAYYKWSYGKFVKIGTIKTESPNKK